MAESIAVEWINGPFQGKKTFVTEDLLYDGFQVQVGANIDGRYDSRSVKVYPTSTPEGWMARWPEY